MDVAKIFERPFVAHLMRMNARFTNRLGKQFAGAVTYFSVLAMVPILMFGFAIAGMILTELRPDLLRALQDGVARLLQGASAEVTQQVMSVIEQAVTNWRGIGLVGMGSLAYAGSAWIGNLKSAVRAQFRPDFDVTENKANIVVETLKNLVILLALLLAVTVTFGVASLATTLTGVIIDLVGLSGFPGISLITRAASLLISLATGWLLFLFLYRVLPEVKPTGRELLIGAFAGAAALAILQYFTGILVGWFLGNPASALFGPVIVIMLFFNLFARLTLMVAAWIATANQPAIAQHWTAADKPLLGRTDLVITSGHWEAAELDRHRQEVKKADAKLSRAETINKVKKVVPGLEPNPSEEKEAVSTAIHMRLDHTEAEHEREHTDADTGDKYAGVGAKKLFADADEPVARSVAERSAQSSMTAGYLSGLATGSGLGAAATLLLSRIFRSR